MLKRKLFISILFICFILFNCIAEEQFVGKFLFLGFDFEDKTVPSDAYNEDQCKNIASKIQSITEVPAYYIGSIVNDALAAFTIQTDESVYQTVINTKNPQNALALLKSKIKVVLKDNYKEILNIKNNGFYNEQIIDYLKDKIEIKFDETLSNDVISDIKQLNSQENIDEFLETAALFVSKKTANDLTHSKLIFDILGITATLRIKIKTEQRNILKDPNLQSLFQSELDQLFTEYENNLENLRLQSKEQSRNMRKELAQTETDYNNCLAELEKQETIIKGKNTTQKEFRLAKSKKAELETEKRKLEYNKNTLTKKISQEKTDYENNKNQLLVNYRKNTDKLEKQINAQLNKMNKENKSLASVKKEIKLEYDMNYFYYPEIIYVSHLTSGEPQRIVRDFKENKTVDVNDILNYLPSSITRYIYNDWKTLGINGIGKKAKQRIISEAKVANLFIPCSAAILNMLPGYGAGLFAMSNYVYAINKETNLTLSRGTLISFGCISLMSMITGNIFMIAGLATFGYYYKNPTVFDPSNILLGIMIPFYAISIVLNFYGLALYLNVRLITYENIYLKNLEKEKSYYSVPNTNSLKTEISMAIKL